MVLEITLLGPPRVRRGGVPVVFETRKAMALLAHLAQGDRPRSRAALCELLYPGHDPERGRGALRRTLSALRSGIGEEWIETLGDGIGLRRGPGLIIDVERFRELAGEGASASQLSEAATLYSGEFLEGFALRDAPDFDHWHQEVADGLRAELASVLRRWVAALADRGELDEAVRCARRWLTIDPLHEPAHRELIRLHAWNGDRAAALDQFRSCVRVLSEELGVAPLAETSELSARVRDGTLPPPVRTVATTEVRPAPAELPAEPQLVGRHAELETLLSAYAGASTGGRLVVIEGEAGIGKTRLASELVRRAQAEGATVLATRCHDDEAGLPYGPIVDLLRHAAGREGSGWTARVQPQHLADAALLLPDLGSFVAADAELVALSGPGAQVRLLDGITAVLGAASAGTVPGIVLVDDAHAADDATLDAITYLGRRLAGLGLVLVVAWRAERVPVGHRLRRLVVDLGRGGRVTVVAPRRLTEGDVSRMVRSAVPAVTPELEQRVFVESEGLPLFVTEYLTALTADGAASAPGTPFPSHGLLDGRLAGLGETARQVLGAAAVIGRTFDPSTLRRTSGRSQEETAGALDELVTHGWVQERADGGAGYDFCHQKLRELVYESTGLARRQLLHGRVAAALAGTGPSGERAALVAHHLRLSGELAEAAEQYRLAAEHAASLHAHSDGLEHLQSAIALGHPDLVDLHRRTGDLRTALGDYAGALAAYEAAAAYCVSPADLARVEHKLGEVHRRRGEWDRAEAHLQAAFAGAAEDQPGLRARACSDLALTVLQAGPATGDGDRARTFAAQALALATAAADRRAEAQVHNVLGVLARSEGAPAEAVEHLACSLAIAEELTDLPAEAAALNNLALVRRDQGDLGTALALTEQALTLCSRYGDRHREAALENNLADLHHALDQDEAAMIHLKRAVALFREVGADEASRLPEIWKLVSW